MRSHLRQSVSVVVILAALLAFGSAASAQTINKCQARKKGCVRTLTKAMLGCHAKAEGKGIGVDTTCLAKARNGFSNVDGKGCMEKLEAKGGCLTIDDAAALQAEIDAFVLDVVQELDPAFPLAILNKCSSGKKKCVSKKTAALLGCHKKAETKGILDQACIDKAKAKFDGGADPSKGCFEKLEAKGDCLTYDDTAALEAKIDAFVADVVCTLDRASPGCPCPSTYQFTANGTATDRDMGWTGLDHDLPFTSNVRFTAAISGCANPGGAPCGVCSLSGPIANTGPGFQYRRCRGDSSGDNGPWITCTGDTDCAGTGNACVFFLGPPQPAAVGGLSVCALYEFAGPITGTLNVESGEAVLPVSLGWRVFFGVTLDDPCPRCVSGLCTAGPRSGQACVVDGTSARFAADVSLDCPLLSFPLLDKTLPTTLATGSQVLTLSADSPSCRAIGHTGERCFCDTCNNAAASPCTSNADCVAVGASICGGKRCDGGTNDGTPCDANSECPGGDCRVPGEWTAPNTCNPPNGAPDGCQPVGGDEGECADGPFDKYCLVEFYRGCLTNADCPLAGDTCPDIGTARPCFLDNGAIGGTLAVTGVASPTAPTLGGLMCVPFSPSSAVNVTGGFPGPARFRIPGTAVMD